MRRARRCGTRQEHADAAWVVATHAHRGRGARRGGALSLRYRHPDAAVRRSPRRRRQRPRSTTRSSSTTSSPRVDAYGGGLRLLDDHGLELRPPAHVPASHEGRRRNVDDHAVRRPSRRGRRCIGRASAGRDPEAARPRARPALGARGQERLARLARTSPCFKDYGDASRCRRAHRERAVNVDVRHVARLGARSRSGTGATPAVHPRLVGPAGHGRCSPTTAATTSSRRVERVPLDDRRLRPQRRAHPQLHRRRARHPQLDLWLPRRGHPQHPRLPGRLPGRPRRQARAELPLDADDPRAPPTRSSRTTAGAWPSRCGPTWARAIRSGSASWPTSTPRRASSPARSSGWSTRASSRAEIAVFYRTNAQSRVLEDMLVRAEIAYQVIGGTKFYERAEIRDAIALPDLPGQPAGRRRVHARRQLAAARDRADVARPRARPRRHDGRCRSGRSPRSPAAVPGLGTAAVQGARALHVDDAARCASASRPTRRSATAARRDAAARPATSRRSRPSARSRRRAGSRTSRSSSGRARVRRRQPPRAARSASSCSRSRCSPTPTTLRDDEGLVTLMTLHNAKGLEFPIVFMIGMEDGVFPHSRALDEGDAGGGAPARPTSASPGRMRDLYADLRAPAQRVRRARAYGAPLALPGRDPRRADRPAGARGARRACVGRRAAGARAEQRLGAAPGVRGAGAERVPHRRRRRPRRVRRRRGHRHRAGRDRRRPLRRRRLGAQAHGRLRPDHASGELTGGRLRPPPARLPGQARRRPSTAGSASCAAAGPGAWRPSCGYVEATRVLRRGQHDRDHRPVRRRAAEPGAGVSQFDAAGCPATPSRRRTATTGACTGSWTSSPTSPASTPDARVGVAGAGGVTTGPPDFGFAPRRQPVPRRRGLLARARPLRAAPRREPRSPPVEVTRSERDHRHVRARPRRAPSAAADYRHHARSDMHRATARPTRSRSTSGGCRWTGTSRAPT